MNERNIHFAHSSFLSSNHQPTTTDQDSHAIQRFHHVLLDHLFVPQYKKDGPYVCPLSIMIVRWITAGLFYHQAPSSNLTPVLKKIMPWTSPVQQASRRKQKSRAGQRQVPRDLLWATCNLLNASRKIVGLSPPTSAFAANQSLSRWWWSSYNKSSTNLIPI